MTLLGIVSMTRVTQVIWIGVYTSAYIRMFRIYICKHISLVAAAHCCLPRSWQVLHELLLLQRQEPQLRAPLVLSIYKFSGTSAALPHSSRPYQAVCVWVCLLLLLCTIVHSSSTVNYYYEPVPPFPSLSLSGDRRLFIYCCYQQILAMWKCYK